MDRATALRALRDVGAAAWFGGSLMGATALNAAADATSDAAERDRVVTAGWARWTPIFRGAAAAHLVGSVGLLALQRSRGAVLGLSLTTSALGAVAGTAALGSRDDSERAVHALEWAIPALLAAVLVTGARRRG